MSNYVFTKTTSNNSKTVDGTNVTVNGVDLVSTIATLVAANSAEDASLAGCAVLANSNTFTNNNTFNNAVTVANTLNASSSGISLSLLPRLASTITPSDDKDLSTKKYVDDAKATCALLASNNTFSGTTNTFSNNLVVTGVTELQPNNVRFYHLPRLHSQIDPENDADLSTKMYVDDSIDAAVPSYSDCVVCGLQTFSYLNFFGGNYYFVSPAPQTSAFQFYINFPVANAGSYYSPTCSFRLNYYYTQATAISSGSISAVGSGSSQTYTSATLLSPSFVTPINTASILPQFETDASFLVTIVNGSVVANAPIQTTTVWTNPSPATSTTGTSVTISAKYGTSPVVIYSVSPISFTYINAAKCRVDVKFPVLNNSNLANDPRQAGWISSCGFTVKLNSSTPSTSLLMTSILTTPNIKTNTFSGGAWLSVS